MQRRNQVSIQGLYGYPFGSKPANHNNLRTIAGVAEIRRGAYAVFVS